MNDRISTWSRVSTNAVYDGWDCSGGENWTVLVEKDHTTGNLYTVTLGWERRDADGNWECGAHNCTEFVGYDAWERASEYFDIN